MLIHSIFDSRSPLGPLDDSSDELGPSPRPKSRSQSGNEILSEEVGSGNIRGGAGLRSGRTD